MLRIKAERMKDLEKFGFNDCGKKLAYKWVKEKETESEKHLLIENLKQKLKEMKGE